MSSDKRKIAAMMYFRDERGCDSAVAGLAALAMMPLDDSAKPSREFRKVARRQAKEFSKSLKKDARPADIDERAAATLRRLSQVATFLTNRGSERDRYYMGRYDQALQSTPSGKRLLQERAEARAAYEETYGNDDDWLDDEEGSEEP
jgi:hypothetical protein